MMSDFEYKKIGLMGAAFYDARVLMSRKLYGGAIEVLNEVLLDGTDLFEYWFDNNESRSAERLAEQLLGVRGLQLWCLMQTADLGARKNDLFERAKVVLGSDPLRSREKTQKLLAAMRKLDCPPGIAGLLPTDLRNP